MSPTKTLNSISGLQHPKSKAMYEKTDELIEKWTKYINIFFHRLLVPILILPKAIQSYFTYFTTDLRMKAFELSTPIW